MNTKRDKFLTEVMGDCWHDLHLRSDYPLVQFCTKCKEDYASNNNFSTWEGFGKLWTWAQEQKWWNDFCFSPVGDGYHCYPKPKGAPNNFAIGCAYIHPDRFADAVYNFLI